MNLAHELPAIGDVDELPEPETGVRIKPHRTRWQQPRRPSEFTKQPGKPTSVFVPPWALDRSLLPRKPPGR